MKIKEDVLQMQNFHNRGHAQRCSHVPLNWLNQSKCGKHVNSLITMLSRFCLGNIITTVLSAILEFCCCFNLSAFVCIGNVTVRAHFPSFCLRAS